MFMFFKCRSKAMVKVPEWFVFVVDNLYVYNGTDTQRNIQIWIRHCFINLGSLNTKNFLPQNEQATKWSVSGTFMIWFKSVLMCHKMKHSCPKWDSNPRHAWSTTYGPIALSTYTGGGDENGKNLPWFWVRTCHDFGYERAAGVPEPHPIHILG